MRTPHINVTPLVDICLVLLIIFMMVSQDLTRGMQVLLPRAVRSGVMPQHGDVVVTVQAGRRIFWEREEVTEVAELTRRLRRRVAPTFVKADAGLTYGEVMPVLLALRAGGAEELRLATRERD